MKTFKKVWKVVVFFAIFLVFLLFRNSFFLLISDVRFLMSGFFDKSFNYRSFKRIEIENQILKDEVLRLRRLKRSGSGRSELNRKEANVYSNYPFNNKDALIIDFGKTDGARVGMPVFGSGDFKNVLIGRIRAVKDKQSEVMTMFDSAWVSGIKISHNDSKAVLKGGVPPRLELVSGETEIKKGDVILNTSSEFPINAPVGVVASAERGTGRFWSRIYVQPLFLRNDLGLVGVATDFP